MSDFVVFYSDYLYSRADVDDLEVGMSDFVVFYSDLRFRLRDAAHFPVGMSDFVVFYSDDAVDEGWCHDL